jgi:uncharacterized surface protein with fasciclin (FAS1) repeats
MRSMPKRTFLKLSVAAAATAALAACGGGDDAQAPADIVGVLQAQPEFSILVEAVVAAGLAPTLKSAGPFTVFAPTNAAFVKLLAELKVTKEALFADTAKLARVLKYHVLAAKVPAASVPVGKTITTVETGVFKIESTGGLKITDESNRPSNITLTDVAASNGVIHVIDTVLLPSDKTIVDVAVSLAPEFSTLVAAVTAAGLVDTLKGPGPFTVFAPTNAAFTAALNELGITPAALLANIPLLTKILTYHVVSGRVLKAEVPIGKPITSVQGETFTIDATLKITDQRARKAGIVATDVFASNGVIHVIDNVILPKA